MHHLKIASLILNLIHYKLKRDLFNVKSNLPARQMELGEAM
jgi:hypothetical protein